MPHDDSPRISIRLSRTDDLPRIMPVYTQAIAYMRSQGNMSQWGNGYPSPALIAADIAKKQHYIATGDDGRVLMVFSFIVGDDPTYHYIEDGRWPDDRPYGTIHRIASTGIMRGMLQHALDFCFDIIDTIRIDTHKDNAPMLQALQRADFERCGIIYIADGSPRVAFQKTITL